MLILAGALVIFTVSQQTVFYAAQMANDAVAVRPSFWLQVAWAIQGLPAVFLMVGLACAVSPFFLFTVAALRREAAEQRAEPQVEPDAAPTGQP